MTWWIFALLSGVGLACRNIFFKASTNQIDAAFSAAILSITMAVVAISFFLYQRFLEHEPVISNVNLKGIGFSMLAGCGVAAANIFLGYAYKTGGMASVAGPLQNGFAISLTLLIGMTLLGEDVKPMQLLGIATAMAGIFMIIRG